MIGFATGSGSASSLRVRTQKARRSMYGSTTRPVTTTPKRTVIGFPCGPAWLTARSPAVTERGCTPGQRRREYILCWLPPRPMAESSA